MIQRKGAKIDFAEAEQEIMEAYHSGINYYDTAYIYPGSEALIGEIFEKNGIREKIKIFLFTLTPSYISKIPNTCYNYITCKKFTIQEEFPMKLNVKEYLLKNSK